MSTRPRVAVFCTNFLPYSQTFVYEQLQAHARYEPEVFAWRRMFADRFPFDPVHVANPAYVLTRHSPAFARRFREASFSVVHAHFGPGGTYALPYAERFDVPLVVTFHGYDVPLLSSRSRAWPLHWPYALRGPHLLDRMTLGLCASSELYDMLCQLGVPAQRLALCRLGIDLSAFQSGQRDPACTRVAMIGRFVEKKGFAYGIRAFARALELVPARQAHLTIVGSGEREAALQTCVRQLGITEHVTFTGPLPQHEVAALLGRTDVLLAPSVVARNGDRESGLIVVKEASACEVVPIGTRHGGIPEIIDDGVTGFLVSERDVARLATRLASLLAEPALRADMGRAGREKMLREYDVRRRVEALEGLYDQAITMHRAMPPRGASAPRAPEPTAPNT